MSDWWEDRTDGAPVDEPGPASFITDPWRDDYPTTQAWTRNGLAARIARIVADEEADSGAPTGGITAAHNPSP